MTELTLIDDYACSSPIAAWLGFSATREGDDVVYTLAQAERHIGNQLIRALHGGAIASFLEFSSQAALHAHFEGLRKITTVNADVDYLSSARAENMKARVRFVRLGRRLAFVEAMGWQRDETAPVAIARFRFRVGDSQK
ncbi:PaaI family thioesterase [Hyphococcus sp.]|uniref:PaaI family thioesterase n=1 Tax=Hyphococcus sp. TaxID=2038636 RepID=UPI0020806499|nr:MAG: hypothetical protein DHS20C04_18570 [Marinicaulis sp.]